MVDVLQQASAWLEQMRLQHRSIPVTYVREGVSVPVQATVARSQFDLEDGAGGALRIETRDYLIAAAELTQAGIALPPRPGDVIREPNPNDPAVTTALAVVAPGRGMPSWRWDDRRRTRLRIHTTPQGGSHGGA